MNPTPEILPRIYSVRKSSVYCETSIDWDEILRLDCDSVKLEILYCPNISSWDIEVYLDDGTSITEDSTTNILMFNVVKQPSSGNCINFLNNALPCEVVILSVSYLRNGVVVGSSLVQAGDCEVKQLKYKIEMPANSKVNLFETGFGDVAEIQYDIPGPIEFEPDTFFQAVSTNGFEFQEYAQTGKQTIVLLTLLNGRAARSAEFWTYETAQTIWLASAQATLEDYTIKEIIPTAGTGGTIVTALPV